MTSEMGSAGWIGWYLALISNLGVIHSFYPYGLSTLAHWPLDFL